jgi:hypothetical protein
MTVPDRTPLDDDNDDDDDDDDDHDDDISTSKIGKPYCSPTPSHLWEPCSFIGRLILLFILGKICSETVAG